MNSICISSLIGDITICEEGGAITRVEFKRSDAAGEHTPLLEEAARQIGEYFEGTRYSFELPIALCGTDFQKSVWQELLKIPYGCVCSYGEIARRIGREKACRAVGMANHCNPIAIVVPCHRVVGANGSLTGYAGGLDKKSFLLDLERSNAPHDPQEA